MLPLKEDAVTTPVSDPFRPYERLVKIRLLKKTVEVPEKNSLLRCFQFLSPETIPYGRFCWNGDCKNCFVTIRNGACESNGLACELDVQEGMDVTSASTEIQILLNAG